MLYAEAKTVLPSANAIAHVRTNPVTREVSVASVIRLVFLMIFELESFATGPLCATIMSRLNQP